MLKHEPILKISTLNNLFTEFNKNISHTKLKNLNKILEAYSGNDWKNYKNDEFEKNKYNKKTVIENDILQLCIFTWNKHTESDIHDHSPNGCLIKKLEGILHENIYLNQYDKILFIKQNELVSEKVSYNESDIILHKIISKDEISTSIHIYVKDDKFNKKIYYCDNANDLKNIIIHTVDKYNEKNKSNNLVNYKEPKNLENDFDIKLSTKNNDIYHIINEIFFYSVNTSSQSFYNQLFGPIENNAVIGEIISTLLNTSMYTYEVAPIFTLMENEVIKNICNLFGFNNGDGTFCPGGSISNLYAMILARNIKLKSTDKNNKQLIGFTSCESHYSIIKNANIIGINKNNIKKIICDENGCMDTIELEKSINNELKNGNIPFFINITAGTTVLSSFDDIKKITDIAQKYDIYTHIDGSYGGSYIFSKKHKYLLNGCENVNSIVLNPHKLLGIPMQCSIFITKEKGILETELFQEAEYLFKEKSKNYDLGRKSIQCGRKTDSLKFWLLWKTKGIEYFEEKINNIENIKMYTIRKIKKEKYFALSHKPMGNNICFHINKNISNEEISNITLKTRDYLYKNGILFISCNNIINKPLSFRLPLVSYKLTYKLIDDILEKIKNAISKHTF
jgi:glutamate/tyrosine decarboxylase-like PLP-dependent enzyme